MMDARLLSRDKVILTALAQHYNLKTGACFPAVGKLAIKVGLGEGKTGSRAVERTFQKADKLGWIRRTMRKGGPREKSQTNQYDLTLPQSICDVLASTYYRPAEPIPHGYRYPQSARTKGRRPDKSSTPTRQNGLTDPSLGPSITRKLEQGSIEHSVSSIRHRSDFVDTGALEDLLPTSKSKKGAIGTWIAR